MMSMTRVDESPPKLGSQEEEDIEAERIPKGSRLRLIGWAERNRT